MNILFAVETLGMGGAELFCVNLANAVAAQGEHQVYLLSLLPACDDALVTGKISPKVKRIFLPASFLRLVQKLDSVSHRTGLGADPLFRYFGRRLASVLREYKIDVIHSHLFKTDYALALANRNIGCRHVVTIHGDYLSNYREPGKLYNVSNFRQKMTWLIPRLDHIAVITGEQFQFMTPLVKDAAKRLHLIYNGVQNKYATAEKRDAPRKQRAQVFGMVARGIPEKGWAFAIEAFLQAAIPGGKLLLIGDSAYLQTLRQQYAAQEQVVFLGKQADPLQSIMNFDAGLLPSVYRGESLPTSVAEYLSAGIPVLATEVGEIRSMITTQEGVMAGELCAVTEGKINVAALAGHMRTAYEDSAWYIAASAAANECFRRFAMSECVTAYLNLYA